MRRLRHNVQIGIEHLVLSPHFQVLNLAILAAIGQHDALYLIRADRRYFVFEFHHRWLLVLFYLVSPDCRPSDISTWRENFVYQFVISHALCVDL